MDNRVYLISLYDYYGELLTEKQKEYFEEYYFNNLSLAEISDNMQISRNAVFKQIKDSEKKLKFYEEKLKLYENSNKIKEIIKPLDEKIQKEIKELI